MFKRGTGKLESVRVLLVLRDDSLVVSDEPKSEILAQGLNLSEHRRSALR